MPKDDLDRSYCQSCANYADGDCERLQFVLDRHGPQAVVSSCGIYQKASKSKPTSAGGTSPAKE